MKELKAYIHTKTCMHMFIAVLFISAKAWKQTRCSSVGEWYIYTKEYYSTLKRNKLSNHGKTCEKLKCIFPSEISQSKKAT